jgi:hypothetical protein
MLMLFLKPVCAESPKMRSSSRRLRIDLKKKIAVDALRLVMRHLRYFFLLHFYRLDIPESESFLLSGFDAMRRPTSGLVLFPKKDRLVNRFLKFKTTGYR